jgi:hypothetical protein
MAAENEVVYCYDLQDPSPGTSMKLTWLMVVEILFEYR